MTPQEAVDEMCAVFKEAWDTTGFPAVYKDLAGEVPATETPWARLSIQHASGRQASFGSAIGERKFTETGILFVQIFTPAGSGSIAAYRLAALVRDAYRTARSPVWYRDTRLSELPREGAFERINVLANFSYDTRS